LSLDLLIPGLLPARDGDPRRPNLERWLARADLAREEPAGAQAWLARRFGVDGLPVAAVTLAVDEAPQAGAWLRADPVYVRVERDTLVLHDASVLEVTPEEARALVAALRELFAPDGIEFRVPRPDRWYARVAREELPETTPLDEAIGADVFGRLPRGRGRINWASALTEIQMLFSTHPVNVAREADRRPPVNGIWFWGGGVLPPAPVSPYARVYANDPFASGLAHLAGARLEPVPGSIDAVEAGEPALVVLDGLDAAADEAWLAALRGALGRFPPVRLVLPSRSGALVATLTARARWRLLRRPRPLSTHA
jgi:hypothetical protein